jgi:hypothetical protein
MAGIAVCIYPQGLRHLVQGRDQAVMLVLPGVMNKRGPHKAIFGSNIQSIDPSTGIELRGRIRAASASAAAG